MTFHLHQKAQASAALFVSDVHLQPNLPRTTAAFLTFLRKDALATEKLFLLGDLFEYWAGDDDLADPYHQTIAQAMRSVSDAGVSVYWLAGNRDFLVGQTFADATGLNLVSDPYITAIGGRRLVVVHGDAQCTDDHGYMAFRAQVRHRDWQVRFLSQPLAQRKAIIEDMREGSRTAQRAKTSEIMDVNPAAIAALFDRAEADVMIHGHTHRPATHEYLTDKGLRLRYVLPDWDCDTQPTRGGWLALSEDGSMRRFNAYGLSSDL